jgi:hypothetical protein
MPTPREHVRAAAAAFADSIYAILRADLSAELRAELHAHGEPPAIQPPGPTPPAPDAATSWIARATPDLVDWVRQHPRATPRDLESGLGWKRSKLFLVLGHATSSGALIKHGASRNVTYDVPGASAAATGDLPPAGTARNVLDRVVAIVRERGPVRAKDIDVGISKTSLYRALATACDEGLLRKIGTPGGVEYAPFDAELPPSPPPSLAQAGGAAMRRAEQVVAYVRDNPGAPLLPLAVALDVSMASVFRAITEAIAAGAIEKVGKGRYVVAGASLPGRPARPRDAARATPAAEGPSLGGEALVDAVVAFVRENPECRYKQLAAATGAGERALHVALRAARDRGAVRVEGAKIKTRYFPTEAPRAPRTAPPAPGPVPSAETPAPTPSEVELPKSGPASSDVEQAEALLASLDGVLAEDMHDLRLGLVLQVIVADIRALRPRFGAELPVAWKLESAIRRITAIRAERGLAYIDGLKRGATANWHAVAHNARRRLAAFDADAGEGPPQAKPGRRTHADAGPARSAKDNGVVAEPLPKLAALAAEKGVVLVGGIKKNEIVEAVRDNHGVRVEWAAMQGSNARATDHFVARIRHGRVGAVVVLEGLFGHSQVGAIVEACKQSGVPFAYGDTAGKASLRGALVELERGVAAAE